MPQTPLHDWLHPKIAQLLADAATAGFGREATLAVIIDIATAVPLNPVPAPTDTEALHGPWINEADDGAIAPLPHA